MSVSEIFEKKTNSIKNFGIVLKYLTRKDYVNMYREYRDVTLNGAVSQMYQEMSGRHSARHECIHIIKTVVLQNSELKRNKTIQFTKTSLRFPKLTSIKRAPTSAHKSTFNASRPKLI